MTDLSKTPLTSEIICLIGRYLRLPELARFKQTCHLFNEIGSGVKFLQPLYYPLSRLDCTLPPLLTSDNAALEFEHALEKVKSRQHLEMVFLSQNHSKKYGATLKCYLAISSNAIEQLEERNALIISLNAEIIQEVINHHRGTELDLSGHNITRLIITKQNANYFRNLTLLYCNKTNPLITLNLEGCVALNWLYCDNSLLVRLNLQNCKRLQTLYCDHNPLTRLNLQGARMIQKVYCNNNTLSTLSLEGCTELEQLYCSHNSFLKILNLKGCKSLHTVYCNNNGLTTLNLRGCIGLKRLHCNNNTLLTTLNLQDLTSPQWVYVDNTPLTTLNMQGTSQLFQKRYTPLAEEVALRFKKLPSQALLQGEAEKSMPLEKQPLPFIPAFSNINKKEEESIQEQKTKKEVEASNDEDINNINQDQMTIKIKFK